MKLLSFIFILLVGQTVVGYSQAPFEIKSCKIDFVFANGFEQGTKTIVFNDSGRIGKEFGVIHVDTSANADIPKEVIGNRTVYNRLIIQKHDSVFVIDLDLLEGSKRAALYFNAGKSANDTLFGNMQKKVGEDTFLRRKCDIYDTGGAKIWYWKGVALKKVLLVDQIYEYATSVDENYVIKPNEFEIPKNVKIQ